jgi:hypothetical protein
MSLLRYKSYLKPVQMKRNLFYSLMIIGLLMPISAASGQSANKETRDVKGFTKINFGIAGDMKIKIGPEFSVVLEGDKDDLEEIVTELSGEKLIVKQENWRFNFDNKVSVYITLPNLTGLGVSGSGNVEILDPINDADNLSLNVSGSGKILTAGLVTDNFSCNISGSGNIIIGSGGNADKGDISIRGSGSYTGEAFEIDHLDVGVSGSGNCLCKAGDSLNARISGSGNVTYIGNPKIDARVSGSGHVRSK